MRITYYKEHRQYLIILINHGRRNFLVDDLIKSVQCRSRVRISVLGTDQVFTIKI